MMGKLKRSNLLLVLYLLTFVFVAIGTTFAYFSTTITSETDNVIVDATKIGVDLTITPLYPKDKLIPTNDSDIITAYENQCVDIRGYSACQAYTISIENVGVKTSYSGTINFVLNDITNLNYLLLDNGDNTYVDITEIESNTDQTLGEEFILNEDESKTFTLLIWLSNYDREQDLEDGGGNFIASVTYSSENGGRVTGTFS